MVSSGTERKGIAARGSSARREADAAEMASLRQPTLEASQAEGSWITWLMEGRAPRAATTTGSQRRKSAQAVRIAPPPQAVTISAAIPSAVEKARVRLVRPPLRRRRMRSAAPARES